MSWSSLASNQTVSFNNLQSAVWDGVFSQKAAIPASNEQITKADANTYVNIDTAYGPYAAKASNQLVVKSDLVASSPSVVNVSIYNGSTNIPITAMTINSVAVSYASGTNFTINGGNDGFFTSDQLGTQNVSITYGSNAGGQNIIFVDSSANSTCHDANSGGGTFNITGATITGGADVDVIASDGTCV